LNISSFAAIAERSGKVDDTFLGVYSPDRNMTMAGAPAGAQAGQMSAGLASRLKGASNARD